MELAIKDLELLAKVANAAAQKAGLVISSFLNEIVSVNNKQGGESLASQVVTEVDELSQKTILEILELTVIPFDLALLTEESEDDKSRFEKDYFWCIDPLDGTLPFIERQSGYSVSIALVSKNGKPTIGVIHDPIKKNTYSAIYGQGAKLNGNIWEPIPSENNKVLTLVSDRSFFQNANFPSIDKSLQNIVTKLGYSGIKQIKHGGATMNTIWVIEHAPACYFKFPKQNAGGGSLWDYAASACIFNALGYNATDIYGNILDLNRLDSTFMNHKGILFASNALVFGEIKKLYSDSNNSYLLNFESEN